MVFRSVIVVCVCAHVSSLYIDIILLALFTPMPLRELLASLYKNTLDHRWDRIMMYKQCEQFGNRTKLSQPEQYFPHETEISVMIAS